MKSSSIVIYSYFFSNEVYSWESFFGDFINTFNMKKDLFTNTIKLILDDSKKRKLLLLLDEFIRINGKPHVDETTKSIIYASMSSIGSQFSTQRFHCIFTSLQYSVFKDYTNSNRQIHWIQLPL